MKLNRRFNPSCLLAVMMGSSLAIGMQRTAAMGLAKTVPENKLFRTCKSCYSNECCPIAILAAGAQVFNCTCMINPSISKVCPSDRLMNGATIGAGIAFFSALVGSQYINNTLKKSKNEKKYKMAIKDE